MTRKPWLEVAVIIVVTVLVFIGLWAIDSEAAVKLGDSHAVSGEKVAHGCWTEWNQVVTFSPA